VLIWLTNFLIFALWYWEMDRGGPGRRAAGHDGPPDFLFPQMNDDRIQPVNWRPSSSTTCTWGHQRGRILATTRCP